MSKIPFYKFELNLATGGHTYTKLIDNFSFEFPTINLDYMGYKSQFCYLPYMADKVGEGKAGSENVFVKGFLKYDVLAEKILN
jgi:carotenoid cleavage dioxygenase-like enzyme